MEDVKNAVTPEIKAEVKGTEAVEAKAETAQTPTADAKTFTEEELNKLLQSERSKAKNEILKALDIKSVDAGKENLTKAEQLELNLKTALDKLEKLEEENAVVKVGVEEQFREEALTLAKAKVNSTKNLEAALKEVVAKFPGLTGKSGEAVTKVGAEKTEIKPQDDANKIIERLNAKYRTNIKL